MGPALRSAKRLKSKICLIGDQAVGKTSLIRRYVLNMFDDHYITTIGTKVSKKEVQVLLPETGDLVDVSMTVWDIMGQEGFREILKEAYFTGAHAVLAVVDLTRKRTLESLDGWVVAVDRVAGKVPMLLAVNKSDLTDQAAFGETDVRRVAQTFNCEYLYVSARTGQNVEEAFQRLGAAVTRYQLRVGE